MNRHRLRAAGFVAASVAVGVAALALDRMLVDQSRLASGLSWLGLLGTMALVMAAAGVLTLLTHVWLAWKGKPAVEAVMVSRLYWLLGLVGVGGSVAYGFGVLKTFTTAFSLFGGMLLGWSLQAPVSGFAAWVLISLKRPFRPGDRVQFPSLGLTGDIQDVGPMYTVLDQVGGSVTSEEAVGRYILVPNAMLFGQVVINYTVSQEAAYMLDEVVVRITYDSDWRTAEKLLLEAAHAVTTDIIQATGEHPYIRADYYDFGVYLRLRYQTRVKDRAEISYEINKRIFESIQCTPSVDIAIPYVYSYRAGQDRKLDEAGQERGGAAACRAGRHADRERPAPPGPARRGAAGAQHPGRRTAPADRGDAEGSDRPVRGSRGPPPSGSLQAVGLEDGARHRARAGGRGGRRAGRRSVSSAGTRGGTLPRRGDRWPIWRASRKRPWHGRAWPMVCRRACCSGAWTCSMAGR